MQRALIIQRADRAGNRSRRESAVLRHVLRVQSRDRKKLVGLALATPHIKNRQLSLRKLAIVVIRRGSPGWRRNRFLWCGCGWRRGFRS